MSNQPVSVSVGLPVFNGERYLANTLDSILQQTYGDFELIISDNASTDRTAAICQEYAARDSRIKYLRAVRNGGAAWNYNRVFELSRGKYFKWAAADDLCAPVFLERCVAVLEQESDVVLAFPHGKSIDENGQLDKTYPTIRGIDSDSTAERFGAAIITQHPFLPVFGVIRRKILAKTKLIGSYSGSDRPLVGELALRGRFVQVPEVLFYYRRHADQSWGGGRSRHQQQAWYDPSRIGRVTFPHWRLLAEHEQTLFRVPLAPIDRLRCHAAMLRWARQRWRYLANNLVLRDG